jgi:hypothetical protein
VCVCVCVIVREFDRDGFCERAKLETLYTLYTSHRNYVSPTLLALTTVAYRLAGIEVGQLPQPAQERVANPLFTLLYFTAGLFRAAGFAIADRRAGAELDLARASRPIITNLARDLIGPTTRLCPQ